MNEQNRLRLLRTTERYDKQVGRSQAESQKDAGTRFREGFLRLRDDVLRPVMQEIGEEIERSVGYGYEIVPAGDEACPGVDLRFVIPNRGGSQDTVRFFVKQDPTRGFQVVAELFLKQQHPFELTRFETTAEVTRDVAEHVIVEAIEQMLAWTAAPEPPEPAHAEPALPSPTRAEPPAPEPKRLEGEERNKPPPPASPLLATADEGSWLTQDVELSGFRPALPFVTLPSVSGGPEASEPEDANSSATMDIDISHLRPALPFHPPR